MSNNEFYQEFQILYNNIMSNQSPGLDEYEVSVFLTKAQEELIKGCYNGTVGNSFEETEELRRYLSSLVKTTSPVADTTSTGKLTNKSYLYTLDSSCWYIVYEQAAYSEGIGCSDFIAEIVPVTHDDLHRTLRNPFKGVTDRRILRVDCGDKKVELISKYPIDTYTIRYIEKPSPIIIDGDWHTSDPSLTIDGHPTSSESLVDASGNDVFPCKLHPALHRKVLDLAVQLAITTLKPPTSNK